MSPLVSVVVPTYNRAHCIGNAVASILGQTFRDLELLVVDDGSKDDTAALMASYHDPRLRYLPQPVNRGRNAVRNVGIREARGEFVAFLDSDDVWLPDKLAYQVAAMQKAPEVALHMSAALFLGENGGTVSYPLLDRYDEPVWARDLGSDLVFPFVSQTWLVRRRIFDEAGVFDESIPAWEEHDWMARVCPHHPVIGSRKTTSVNFHSPGSVTSRVVFKPEVAAHFVQRYCAAYGATPKNEALALAITGWCGVRYGDFASGRRTLWNSLSKYPWQPAMLANALLASLGQDRYRAVVKRWRARQAR